ncbi:MAG: hypothetical protein JWO76_2884 [Nocardioides sp.]|nr:hypothetical protein [Nocardioides sp.]
MKPARVASRRPAAALASVLILLSLGGCGRSDDGGPEGRPTGGPTTTADGLTAPGTSLRVGDSATVPRTDGTGTIRLTVTSIVEGTSRDLEGERVADADEKTPFFVNYEMTVVSGNAYGMDMRHYLSAWADDEAVGFLIPSGPYPTCQEVNFPLNATAGTAISSCRTYVTDKGAPPVDSVRFDNEDGYQSYEDTAVEWRRE